VRFAWLTSSRDEQAVRLFEFALAQLHSAVDLEVAALIAPPQNEPSAPFAESIIALAERYGVAVETFVPPIAVSVAGVSVGHEDWRKNHDERLRAMLQPLNVDILMLAGYMLVVGPVLLGSFAMLNLHPALPDGPAGTQDQVVSEIMSSKPPVIGAMVHWVTKDIDRGPPVEVIRIRTDEIHPDLWELAPELQDRLIRDAIRREEPALVVNALKSLARDKSSHSW
jgi:phosphoribosylglycinamide formyltransferase-1